MAPGDMTFSTKIRFMFTFLLLITTFQCAHSQDKWPEYNQQCRDDAGPPYVDDEENFGKGGKYHDKSSAFPILQNGKCAPPIQEACKTKPIKTAYLEGPIDCGDKGWYCRLTIDKNWKNFNLRSDLNFAHCNTTIGFSDDGYDQDGHCHGSSHDNVYYWWVRDHWHRQYNGHLRCCCGWFKGSSSTPMYERRIANRCDYRRLVTKKEPLDKCRDANEDHGMGFDDIGCNRKKYGNQIGKPIPEDDGICWEVARFGYTEKPGGTKMPSVTGGSPAPSTEGGGDECEENPKTRFFLRKTKKGAVKTKSCKWLGKKKNKQKRKICRRDNGNGDFDPANIACPITCDTCDEESTSSI